LDDSAALEEVPRVFIDTLLDIRKHVCFTDPGYAVKAAMSALLVL
jgi:hypothetical protein